MTRVICVVLVFHLWFSVALSAQQPNRGPLSASLEREATRLASTLSANDPERSTGFSRPVAQIGPLDDWDAVRRLNDGTRVLVTTNQGRGINGRLNTVSEDTLQIVVRWRRKETLLRHDIREVRLRHRLSVGEHAGLGLLVGGVTGLLAGAPCVDCPVNVGLVYGTFLGGIGGFVIGEGVHARPGRLVYARTSP